MKQKHRTRSGAKTAKRRMSAEGRSLDAGASSSTEREAAYQLFCNRPFKLTPKLFRQVLEEDAWGV
jgi:hypothetical protein